MSGWSSYLAQYDEQWHETEVVDDSTFEDLPDGKYQCRIDEVAIEQAKTSGRLQLKWVFVVENGEYETRKIWKYSGLENPENFKFLKTELKRIGIDLSLLSMLPDELQNMLDRIVEVQIKTKHKNGEKYRNIYVNKRLGVADDGPFPDDDVPF